MEKKNIPYHYMLPKGLMIEPTNLCDLRCVLCPCGNGDIEKWGLPRGMMTLGQFKGIIDQARNFIEYIVLWGLGEPMLVPDLDRMIDYAEEHDISVFTSVHGNNLNSALSERLIKSGLSRILFAIDGLTQKTYEKYRRGGSYKKAFDNLKNFVKIKRKLNSPKPFVVWQFMVMRHNEHEVPMLIKLAKDIGVDSLYIKKFTSNSKKFAPLNPNYIRKEPKAIGTRCKFLDPGGRPMIYFNGDVSVCCHDFRMKHVMGNIFKEKLVDIWNNNLYKKFREDFSKNLIPECVQCRAKSYINHFIVHKFH